MPSFYRKNQNIYIFNPAPIDFQRARERQGDRETERERERQTDRQTDRERDRQTERERERERERELTPLPILGYVQH